MTDLDSRADIQWPKFPTPQKRTFYGQLGVGEGGDCCGLELFWVCYSVYFEAEFGAGVDEGVDVAEGVEHPDFPFRGRRGGGRHGRGIGGETVVVVVVVVVEGSVDARASERWPKTKSQKSLSHCRSHSSRWARIREI
jgi:hypothetical protein